MSAADGISYFREIKMDRQLCVLECIVDTLYFTYQSSVAIEMLIKSTIIVSLQQVLCFHVACRMFT